jgi:hypothetical protein
MSLSRNISDTVKQQNSYEILLSIIGTVTNNEQAIHVVQLYEICFPHFE